MEHSYTIPSFILFALVRSLPSSFGAKIRHVRHTRLLKLTQTVRSVGVYVVINHWTAINPVTINSYVINKVHLNNCWWLNILFFRCQNCVRILLRQLFELLLVALFRKLSFLTVTTIVLVVVSILTISSWWSIIVAWTSISFVLSCMFTEFASDLSLVFLGWAQRLE